MKCSLFEYKGSFAGSLPEFLYGGLLLPCDNSMSRVVDGEEEDVPITTEPGDEKGTGERLEGQLNHLSGTHPGGGDTQYHQQTTQHLQSCVGTCLIGPALSAGLAARCLCMRLWTVLSWWETAEDKTITENALQHLYLWTPLSVQRPNKISDQKLFASKMFLLFRFFSHGSHMALWIGQPVSPPPWSRLKYINNRWMDCLARHLWSSEAESYIHEVVIFWLLVKLLENHWMDCHEIRLTYLWCWAVEEIPVTFGHLTFPVAQFWGS